MKTEDNHDNSADIEFYAGTGDNIIESKMKRFHWRQQQEASLTQSATGGYQNIRISELCSDTNTGHIYMATGMG